MIKIDLRSVLRTTTAYILDDNLILIYHLLDDMKYVITGNLPSVLLLQSPLRHNTDILLLNCWKCMAMNDVLLTYDNNCHNDLCASSPKSSKWVSNSRVRQKHSSLKSVINLHNTLFPSPFMYHVLNKIQNIVCISIFIEWPQWYIHIEAEHFMFHIIFFRQYEKKNNVQTNCVHNIALLLKTG